MKAAIFKGVKQMACEEHAEPTIIDGILKIRTDVKIIWLNTVHSHRVPEPTGLPWLRGDYRGF